jgi:hypothetical protein
MKTTTADSRHHQRRDFYRGQIAQLGNFVEGTLCKVQRPGRKPPAWQLTFKQAGKTRTVYVPVALAPEVQQWAREFRHLKQLVRKVTQHNLAIIRRHVGARRAASRGQRLIRGHSGANSSKSFTTVSRN